MTATEAAVNYIKAGFSPVPLIPNQKRPALKDWTRFKESPIGLQEAEELFNSTNSLGLICGYQGLEVLDIDSKNFEANEYEEFLELLNTNAPGLIEKVVIQHTPSGGKHFIYKCEKIEGNKKLAKNSKKEVTFETRGDGGQIAAYPSPGYRIEGKLSKLGYISESEREILHLCAREMDRVPPQEIISHVGRQYSNNTDLTKPWDDYNAKQDVAELLIANGWSVVRDSSKFIYLKRPGVTSAEWSGKVFRDSGLLYVWSTSTAFEAEKCYTAFQVLAILQFNSDFQEAARFLVAEGYGERLERPAESITKSVEITEPDEVEKLLEGFILSPELEISNPEPVISVIINYDIYTLGTYGNFSVVQGKAKSRKSYFLSALAGAALSSSLACQSLRGHLTNELILYFDTEQGDSHAQRVQRRILSIAGYSFNKTHSRLKYFTLRKMDTNEERLQFIKTAISFYEKKEIPLGLVIIDGIADVAKKGVNDEEEATAIASLLLKMSANTKAHFITAIHENKGDRNAKGHLGAYLVQKAETVYSVYKEEDTTYISGEYTRNKSFPELALSVSKEDGITIEQKIGEAKGKSWTSSDEDRLAPLLHNMTVTEAVKHLRYNEDCTPTEAEAFIYGLQKHNLVILEDHGKRRLIRFNAQSVR